MARLTRTAAELVSDVRLRSGLEDGQFRTDANIRRYLEESGFKMFGKIDAEFPGAYYLFAQDTMSAVNGTALYDLPADCFKPITFRVTVNGVRDKIPKALIDEMDRDVTSPGWGTRWPQHRVMGFSTANPAQTQVMFTPTPTASHTVTIWYIPQSPFILEDTPDVRDDDLDITNGKISTEWNWEEYMVLDAAIKVKNDQEEDPRALMVERQELWDMIYKQVETRTVTEAPRIKDAFPEYSDPLYYTRRMRYT